MHTAALAALKLPGVYLPFAVEPGRLAAAVAGAAALGLRGLNVTIPHKAATLGLCEPDALALEVGAVNTLTFEDDRILGTNTDVHGLEMLLAGIAPQPGPALILGAGGAARAAVVALRRRGHEVTVVSRREACLVVGGVECKAAPWAALPSLLRSATLVVDATGRSLTHDDTGLDCALLPDIARVVDLVVKSTTPLVAAARARGLLAVHGAEMLVQQGAASLTRWTGLDAPVEIMRQALADALDGPPEQG